MAPVKYILYYVDKRGHAEAIRYMFYYKQQPFDNCRIGQDEWLAYQEQFAGRHFPVLEIQSTDDKQKKVLSKSIVIARYVGSKLDLTSSDPFEQAKLDEAACYVNDLWHTMACWLVERDEQTKENLRNELVSITIPDKLNQWLKLTGVSHQQPFFDGNKPTWADFYIVGELELINNTLLRGEMSHLNRPIGDYMARLRSLKHVEDYILRRTPTPTGGNCHILFSKLFPDHQFSKL